jgi:hypothetical protein
VEIAVVMEEGVVLRRGSLVLCLFGGEEYCGVDDPFGLDLHQQFDAHRGRIQHHVLPSEPNHDTIIKFAILTQRIVNEL